MRRRRLLAPSLVLSLSLVLGSGGCVSTGRTAYRYFNWAGETFTENPVSMPFFTLGLIVFFIAGVPLDLITWPVTAIAYSDEEYRNDKERYYACAFSPSFFLGTSGGVLLGAIFYPFGWPLVPSDDPKKAWDDERPDDGPLPPPPGGDTPPPATREGDGK